MFYFAAEWKKVKNERNVGGDLTQKILLPAAWKPKVLYDCTWTQQRG